MKITDALKADNSTIRVTNGDRWMYWHEGLLMWQVVERPYNARVNRILCTTAKESEAIAELIKE